MPLDPYDLLISNLFMKDSLGYPKSMRSLVQHDDMQNRFLGPITFIDVAA